MIHNLISCVFVRRTNFVCLRDRASLSIHSSKTPFPFFANADPSLCALHSFPTQQITSWPVTGEMAHFCLNSSLALHLVPWHIQQTQSVNTRKPSEAEDKQRSQSPAVRPTRTHTHALINEEGRVSLLSVIRFSWAEAASCLDDHLVIYLISKGPGKCSPWVPWAPTISASLSSIAAVNQYATVDHRHHVSEIESGQLNLELSISHSQTNLEMTINYNIFVFRGVSTTISIAHT